jgi:hypothetical protein
VTRRSPTIVRTESRLEPVCEEYPLYRIVVTPAFVRVALLTTLVVCMSPVAGCQQASDSVVQACGSTIAVHFDSELTSPSRADLLRWVSRASEAVCAYYGKFPVPHVNLNVHVRGSAGAHAGTTYPEGGGLIRISVGKDTSVAQLEEDWMLTHEMIHLAFPEMAEDHHWIEEGISVYVEPIARVQAGQLSAERMWSDVVRDMPQGEPANGDRGLDNTHTWGRTYWGGAMFCLVADVRIRKQTASHKGLQDALRGILAAGGNITQDWEIERALAVGDKATGTTVLIDLYHGMRNQPDAVDLAAMWKEMGIERAPNGVVQLNASAPLANVRAAITQPRDGN